MAALLACGEGPAVGIRNGKLRRGHDPAAILSHQTAASLWNLLAYPRPGDVCVTSMHGRGATRPGIEAHRATLDPRDVRRRHRMPLTSPPRTILDLAADLGAERPALERNPLAASRLDDLESLVAEAGYRRLATEAELRDQLDRNPRKPGVRALRALLEIPGGPRRTRSPAERSMLRLLRKHDIAGYEVNARACGHEVDFLWRDLGFAIEVDGYDAHAGPVAFERDRLKVAKLEANGISVMPVTGRRIGLDPDGVIARVLAALSAARSRSARSRRTAPMAR